MLGSSKISIDKELFKTQQKDAIFSLSVKSSQRKHQGFWFFVFFPKLNLLLSISFWLMDFLFCFVKLTNQPRGLFILFLFLMETILVERTP